MAEHLQVDREICVRIGTLSKALGSSGGFVSGSRSLVDWLANKARAYVFSTAPPAANCAAALAALDIVEREPDRRIRLLERAAGLRQQLQQQGWNVGAAAARSFPCSSATQPRATALQALLAERGLFVPAIRPPSVPPGTSRLRISLSAAHGPEMIAELVQALADGRSME